MYLAQNIKFLRKQKEVTQQEMADALGINQSSTANWESDTRKPDIETIVRIAEYFGVTLDDLILKDLKPPIPIYITNIQFLRTKQEMTQEEMANLLGFKDNNSIFLLEKGRMQLSIENMEKICDFFGVTLDQFVKRDLSKEGM